MQFITDVGPLAVSIEHLTIAGWTGRDAASVQHHIDELATIGVAPPSQVPLFYRVASDLLTTEANVQVLGEMSSGEAEPLVIRHSGKTWIGLGSDHTDRALETASVAASKQACCKPCASVLWDFDPIAAHLDQVTIQSWIWEADAWVMYQNGSLAQILPLVDLIDGAGLSHNSAMLCGTFAAIGGVRGAAKFRARMSDPIRNTDIQFEYEATPLPIIS